MKGRVLAGEERQRVMAESMNEGNRSCEGTKILKCHHG